VNDCHVFAYSSFPRIGERPLICRARAALTCWLPSSTNSRMQGKKLSRMVCLSANFAKPSVELGISGMHPNDKTIASNFLTRNFSSSSSSNFTFAIFQKVNKGRDQLGSHSVFSNGIANLCEIQGSGRASRKMTAITK
jgi:hypothetical protein